MPPCRSFVYDDSGTMVCRCHQNAVRRVILSIEGLPVRFDFCPTHEREAVTLAFHPNVIAIEVFPVLELR